jgi:hypothetical protein
MPFKISSSLLPTNPKVAFDNASEPRLPSDKSAKAKGTVNAAVIPTPTGPVPIVSS